MFCNTAYEAMYYYIGLALHSKFIEVITSQRIFLGAVTLIFGIMFFVTTVQFFSRYLPGALVTQRTRRYRNISKSPCALLSVLQS